jgi:hypothetical protein
MEDDIIFFENGRQPHSFENGRLPHFLVTKIVIQPEKLKQWLWHRSG